MPSQIAVAGAYMFDQSWNQNPENSDKSINDIRDIRRLACERDRAMLNQICGKLSKVVGKVVGKFWIANKFHFLGKLVYTNIQVKHIIQQNISLSCVP